MVSFSDTTLESARQQLVVALLDFNRDSHFGFISAALEEIRVCFFGVFVDFLLGIQIKALSFSFLLIPNSFIHTFNFFSSILQKIMHVQSSWLQKDDTQAERLGYFHLMANAVVWLVSFFRIFIFFYNAKNFKNSKGNKKIQKLHVFTTIFSNQKNPLTSILVKQPAHRIG